MLAKLHKLQRLRFEACLACTIHLILSIRPLVKAVNLEFVQFNPRNLCPCNLCLHKHSMEATLSITLHRGDKGSQLHTMYLVEQNKLNYTPRQHIQTAVSKVCHTCKLNIQKQRA